MPEDTLAGQVLGFMEQTTYKQVCSTLIFAEALHSSSLAKPQAWETRNICDVVNNAIASGELKGWHSYQGSRRYARYGKQRENHDNCFSSSQERLTELEHSASPFVDCFLPLFFITCRLTYKYRRIFLKDNKQSMRRLSGIRHLSTYL